MSKNKKDMDFKQTKLDADFEGEVERVVKNMKSGGVNFKFAGEDDYGEFDKAELIDEYMEKAESAKSKATAIKYAKMALELNPDYIEAEVLIANRSSKTPLEYQQNLEILLKKEKAHLKKLGITEKNSDGNYYMIFETRPYIRIYAEYIENLVIQGKLRKAAAASCKVLELNKNDNLGIRYKLAAIYAALEERELLEQLYQKYESAQAFMLLPLIALYYKSDEYTLAKEYLRLLYSHNKEIKKAVRILKSGDADVAASYYQLGYYHPFSTEEIVLAYMENCFLYAILNLPFLEWLEKNIPAKNPSKKTK